MKPQIGIIGYAGQEEYPNNSRVDPECYKSAYEIGKKVGGLGWVIVTGGKSGIMESASKGCQEAGGISVGVVSGSMRYTGNDYLEVEVVTNGYPTKEESILIGMSDAVVMIGGGAGTLLELATAYRMAKPIIILSGSGGWADKIKSSYLDERKRVKIIRSKNIDRIIRILKKVV